MLLVCALGACAGEVDEPLTRGRDAAGAPDDGGRRLTHNRLTHNRLTHNALTGNPSALRSLAQRPLSSATFGTLGDLDLRTALHDPWAQDAFAYLVSCALPAGAVVTWQPIPSLGGAARSYQGELGLCPSWASAGPEQPGGGGSACEEYVSACLLARVNAFGKPVMIGLRGTPTSLFDPTALVSGDGFTPAGDSIYSFRACAKASSRFADCGWRPANVGACVPGEAVDVGMGARVGACGSPLGTGAGDTVLRVCSGPHGCDGTDGARLLAQADDTCGLNPAVAFTCPSSGLFSVQWAPYSRPTSLRLSPTAAAVSTSLIYYPGQEIDILTTREAAFYGNVFAPDALNPLLARRAPAVDPQTGAVVNRDTAFDGAAFVDMYACWADDWSYGGAYMANRICGGPTADSQYDPATETFSGATQCTARIVGPCNDTLSALNSDGSPRWVTLPDASGTTYPLAQLGKYAEGPLCESTDPWGSFGPCQDPAGQAWAHPITVALAEKDALCALGAATFPATFCR